jgi:chemotaxis signal transduction protein
MIGQGAEFPAGTRCSENNMADESSAFFLVARIGSSERLIELAIVREIVPAMQLTIPQGVGGGCCGIANVRGEVVPVFDSMQRGGELEPTQLIVIAQGAPGHFTGLVVDDVLEMVELPADRVVDYPVGLGRRLRSANLNGRVLTVLNLSEVIDVA